MKSPGNIHHPIIDQPWQFSIAEFHYHVGLDGEDSFIDLTLLRGTETRRLRFSSPVGFSVEEGLFPQPTHGMQILDVRDRQLDGIGVEVSDFESSHGAIRFMARTVVDLDSDCVD